VANTPPREMVSVAHEAFAVIVTVLPEQIVTTSPATGEAPAATPPQATVDHVAATFQFPLAREK